MTSGNYCKNSIMNKYYIIKNILWYLIIILQLIRLSMIKHTMCLGLVRRSYWCRQFLNTCKTEMAGIYGLCKMDYIRTSRDNNKINLFHKAISWGNMFHRLYHYKLNFAHWNETMKTGAKLRWWFYFQSSQKVNFISIKMQQIS